MNVTPSSPKTQARDLFLAALDMDQAADRASFLNSACGGDDQLRQRVEELLAARDELGDFMRNTALADPGPASSMGLGSVQGEEGAPMASLVGERIGRYKLLERIGEGGCGAVYRAGQEEPIRRSVALKVIKPGMGTQSVISRFEAERQALALMDHPNIAKVLDAGTTEGGRPYFVMELVEGVRITEYCDQHRLKTRERLDLVVKVCHAIQHAHQKGIIHRDIKPSNILVTLQDGRPVPKVIDFGIAKAVEQPVLEKALGSEPFLGTPAYMSPEQAEMSGVDIDTRSDIYSLGVLLYELLTGQTPFDGRALVESGWDVMRQTIRETEAERPSVRVAALGRAEAEALGGRRRERTTSLVRTLRGDLDWVVMKAVAKDRTRRYESVSGLGRDLERFLTGQPITAHPPSGAYQFHKFVDRNRLLVGAGASMLLVLLLATVISSWQAFRATRAERDRSYLLRVAEAARQKEVRHGQQLEIERTAALRRAYNSDMNLVPQALLANNYGRVMDLLSRHRTPPAASRPGLPEPVRDFRQWEWRYYWNQARSEAAFALPRQSNSVTRLAISPDGQFLASSDRRGTLKLWDLPGRKELRTLRVERHGDSPFAFSHQNNRLAAIVQDGTRGCLVKIWAAGSEEEARAIECETRLQALAFTTNDSSLLLFTEDESIYRWPLNRSELERSGGAPARGSRGPRSFGGVFSPDTALVASVQGRRICVMEVATGAEKCTMAGFEQGNASLAFSPDGSLLAVSPLFTEIEQVIKVYRTADGKEAGRMVGHRSWVPGLTFSSDGRRLISAGADQTVRVWKVDDFQEGAVFRGHLSEVNCVVLSPDGQTILSGCKDGTLLGWDATRTERKKPFEIVGGEMVDATFLPNGRQLLGVGRDGTVSVWALPTGQEDRRLQALGRGNERVLVSPDGQRVYAAARGGEIRVLDWATQRVVTNLAPVARQWSPVIPLAILDQGRTLMTVGPEFAVRLWDTKSWQSRSVSLSRDLSPMFGARVALSLNERLLALPASQGTVEILNLREGRTEARLNVENWGAGPMAFSPNGALLAMASREGTVNLWNAINWTSVDVLRGHLLGVHGVAFSPDGERLASASAMSEAVKLWDVPSRHEVATLAGEGSLFERVKFSPDGTVLLALNTQGQVHLWWAPALEQSDRSN